MSKSIAGLSMVLSATAAANSASTSIDDFGDCRRASESELNDMRGGFEINAGGMQLLLSLGIERVTYVNGVLVAMNSLNLLPGLNASQLSQAINSQNSASSGPQAPPSPSMSTLASPTSVAAPSSAAAAPTSQAYLPTAPSASVGTSVPATSPTLSTTAPVPPSAPTTTINLPAPASVALPANASPVTVSLPISGSNNIQPIQLVQIGPGNTFIPPNVANLTSSMMTVIQNRLDDQVIHNMTIINATLANSELIRSMAMNAALSRIPAYLSR